MKKSLCILLACLMLLPTFVACQTPKAPENESTPQITQPTTPPPAEPTDPVDDGNTEPEPMEGIDKTKHYSILFIGNSYTFYPGKNNQFSASMPASLFAPMADSAGYTVTVEMITVPGNYLYKFDDPTDTEGGGDKVAKALSEENYGKYDFVILQDHSQSVLKDVDRFYSSVRSLVGKIRAIGAQPILYATWGRKAGHQILYTYNLTNESMTWKITAAYTAIGRELDVPVANVGLAFFAAQKSVEIYDEDRSHPSYAGSYLIAATLFATIFNEDPEAAVTYMGDSRITKAQAEFLRHTAKQAVFSTPAIPEEYQTTTTPGT